MVSLKKHTDRNQGVTWKVSGFNLFTDNLEECENTTLMKPDSKWGVATMAEDYFEEKTTESLKFTLASHHLIYWRTKKEFKTGTVDG